MPTPRSRRQQLNESTLLEESLPYAEFVKRFRKPELDKQTRTTKLIGCKRAIQLIRNRIKFEQLNFALLTGPSGTGKTIVVKTLAQSEPKLNFFYLKSSWTLQKRFGDVETRIDDLFYEAIDRAPSLIFIDEIDIICNKKRNDVNNRVFNVLEDRLASLKERSPKILVLAATNQPEALDPALRVRYFRREIRFTMPTKEERMEALQDMVQGMKLELKNEEILTIAEASHCYSFEDLSELFAVAAENSDIGCPTFAGLKAALQGFKPFAIESVTTPCPPLRWEDIGGVSAVKKLLQKSVILPLKHKDKFQQLGFRPNKGAILFGPPGCSKTMLARALATESGYNFISVKGPELISKYVGDSEAAVRRLFRNAREIAPTIIFFDEIDGLAPERSDNQSSSVGEKVVTSLLPELDGITPNDDVFIMAATNRPDRVDRALMRPGRLNPAIYIPLPNLADRKEIFKVHMRPLPCICHGNFVCVLASSTPYYSGADIAEVCTRAAGEAFDKNADVITMEHFLTAIDKVKPSTRKRDLDIFNEFCEDRSIVAICGGMDQLRI